MSHFTVERKGLAPLSLSVNLPGEHNVLNALAGVAVAHDDGVDETKISSALESFQGIGRRFEQVGTLTTAQGEMVLVDDYGHHPTEVKATITAMRNGWPDKRLVMVFQPHRYSRTRDLYEDFVEVLSEVDCLYLLDVYAGGETPINGADSKSLARSIRQRGQVEPVYVSDVEQLAELMHAQLEDNDMVITQGAGTVSQIGRGLYNNPLLNVNKNQTKPNV